MFKLQAAESGVFDLLVKCLTPDGYGEPANNTRAGEFSLYEYFGSLGATIYPAGDVDWYTVTVPAAAVSFTLSSPDDVLMDVYSDGDLVAQGVTGYQFGLPYAQHTAEFRVYSSGGVISYYTLRDSA